MTLCDCGFVAPTGCGCGFHNSDGIEWLKVAGQEAQRKPSVLIDSRSDNLLVCGASGLLAAVPTRFLTPPSAAVYLSTTMTTGNGTATPVTYNAELFDNDTIWSAGLPTQLRPATPGYYYAWAQAQWQGNNAGYRHQYIQFSNSLIITADLFFAVSATAVNNHVGAIYPFDDGDYFEVYLQQNSGGTRTVDAADATTNFSQNSAGMIFLGDL